MDGFSHKLALLCQFIFQTLAGVEPDEDAFQRIKEALVRQVSPASAGRGACQGRRPGCLLRGRAWGCLLCGGWLSCSEA